MINLDSKIIELGTALIELESTKNSLSKQEEEHEVKIYLETKQELENIEKRIRELKESIGNTITDWTPDTFSKGKKEKYQEGKVLILRSTKRTRVVEPEMFTNEHPTLVALLVKKGKVRIPIGEIENEMTKDELNTDIEKGIRRQSTWRHCSENSNN